MVDMDVTDKDYYDILGLDRDADDRAIKAAFRRQAWRYHPDVNHGDATAERRFKDVNEAYRILVDPVQRDHYNAACGATSAWTSPVQNRAAPPARPRAGALRRLWWEECEAVAYVARRSRVAVARLGVRTHVAAVIGSLLLCLLARQVLGSPPPRLTTIVGATDKTSAAHTTDTRRPRRRGPTHARAARSPARPTPTYLFGGCLRHCSPAAAARGAPAGGALSRAPHPRSSRPPVYLYDGCVRRCSSARRGNHWHHTG